MEMKYSPISAVEIFANIVSRYSKDSNVANISYIGDYTTLIHNNEIDAIVNEFRDIEKYQSFNIPYI